jgi:hypothetical protein
LRKWIDWHVPDGAFASTDTGEVIQAFERVMKWAQAQDRYIDRAKAEFADSADGWLVAHAMTTNAILVTHEKPEPMGRRKIKIPEVCNAFGVPYTDTFEMLRSVGSSFVLNGSGRG